MIQLLSIVCGLYVLIDSVYLAGHTQGEDRFCQIAKYTFAFMTGAALMFNHTNGWFLLSGMTIALFMWPDTWYRALHYLRVRYPGIYYSYVNRFGMPFRRRVEK